MNMCAAKKDFCVMGVVNTTPDSFYDGGRYGAFDSAVMHAEQLIREGADILDFGGASSRPGAVQVDQQDELERVVPVIRKIASGYAIPVSIDTTWASVAEAALDAGATIVNDISAGRFDRNMVSLVAQRKCDVILMHSRKEPQTMQQEPFYSDVVNEVQQELLESVSLFLDAGVVSEKILLDPGIGFAKSADHNVALLHDIDKIVMLGYPVVLGTSRKNFIGKITGRDVDNRLYGSLGSIAGSFYKGVKIFRVHDVAATVDFFKVVSAIESLAAIP